MRNIGPTVPLPSMVISGKIIHVFAGIYFWEWICNLQVERDVILRRRPLRLSHAVYILCRTGALAGIVTEIVGLNLPRSFDCEAWFRAMVAFIFITLPSCSLLMTLRAAAIWSRKRVIVAIIFLIWTSHLGAALFTSFQGKAAWSPLSNSCRISGTHNICWGILADLLAEFTILSMMLVGLQTMRDRHKLWQTLYVQGIVWLVAAVSSKIPPMVLSFMDIDDGWNMMFRMPHVVIMVTTATRVYRELELSDVTKYFHPASIQPPRAQGQMDNPLEVSVHKTIEVEVVEFMPRSATQAHISQPESDSHTMAIAGDSAHRESVGTVKTAPLGTQNPTTRDVGKGVGL